MAFNDGLYWYKNVLKKQLKLASRIYLSIAIVLAPIFLMSSANAANVGGWTLGGGVAQGASTVYEGTKKVVIDGVDYIKKGTAKITPPASGVAKVLARGAAGYALSVAVEQLLGSVDWVLDPANNQIVYTKPQDPTKVPPDSPICWTWSGGTCESLDSVVKKILSTNMPGWKIKSYTCPTASSVTKPGIRINCTSVLSYPGYPDRDYPANPLSVVNPNYDPSAEPQDEKKTLPLDVVAQKVISNAESGDTNAQAATVAAAADIVAEAEKDSAKARPIAQQLESSAQTKPVDEAAAEKANEAQGQSKPNEANPEAMDLSLEFPVFCGWAPLVCEAAQVVISFPNTLTGWWDTAKSKSEEWALSISEAWTAAKDWATSEPEKEDSTELEFEELDLGADEVNLSGSNTCPQDSVSFSVMGQSVTLDMPYQPVCDALNFFKPAVLLVGAVASVYIVAGVRTKEEDEV